MEIRTAVVKCGDYAQAEVDAAVRRSFDLLGGLGSIVKPGMRVAIKANLLKKAKPEDCVCTHPALVCAVAKQISELGAFAVIGDSPGGPFTEGFLRGIYRESGMEQAAQQSGAQLNANTSYSEVKFPEGVSVKALDVCDYLLQADVIINVAKLKTHGLTVYTGAVKNMFGAIPGTAKVEYHFRMPELDRFCNMLIDITECVKPAFNLIDAVMGMEGEGPGSGTPRFVGCLIASQSPYAADMAGISLMNQDPMSIATIEQANKRGLLPKDLSGLELVGDDIQTLIVKDFNVPSARIVRLRPRMAPEIMMNFVERMLKPKPIFLKESCIGCGDCMRSCPPKAITIENRLAKADLKKCIRCFCCQELCPRHAIKIKRSRILQRLK